jgi:Spy/CpxP family protein refolding chaperone
VEEYMRKTVTALAALGIIAALAAAAPAQAEEHGWGHHRPWGEGSGGHEWRDHGWQGSWRGHRWSPRYYGYYGYGSY